MQRSFINSDHQISEPGGGSTLVHYQPRKGYMATIRIKLMPFNKTASSTATHVTGEEVVLSGDLEILSGDDLIVRVPFGTHKSDQGRVVFTSPRSNVLYAVSV